MDSKPSEKKATILDIAQRLNISHTTVSRALRGTGRISEAMQQKVLTEARRLGYKPNRNAVALRNQSSQLIGFLVNSLFSLTVDQLLVEIQGHAHSRGFGVLAASSAMEPKREIEALDLMVSKQVEGIILQSISPSSLRLHEALAQLLSDGIHVVHLLDEAPVAGVSTVGIDNEMAGYLAGRHLLELGHKRILFIADDRPERRWPRRFSLQRYGGLLRAYEEFDLPRPHDLIAYENSHYHGYEATLNALDEGLQFSAVFAYSDQSALGALIALKERGIKIPQNCSIVGFADSLFTQHFARPSLTTVHLPFDRVGAEAIRLVLDEDASGGERIVIEPTLIVRESTIPFQETIPPSSR